MNNIYKVIWSKAKNCYVVASEIARSHTKSASGSEKIGGGARHALLALGAACAIACGGFVNVGAADTVEAQLAGGSTATVYTKEGTELYVAEQIRYLTPDGDVLTNRNNIAALQTTTTDQGQKIATNTANIANNAAALDTKADKTYVDTKLDGKADKATTLAGYGINDAYTKDATNTAITTKVNKEKNARELKDAELSGRIDTLSTTVDSKVSKTDLNTTLGNYYTQAETNAAIKNAVDDEKNARENAINGEVTNRNKAIADAIAVEETKRDAAITNAKTELKEKVTEEETKRKEEDAKLEGKITENTTAINNEKAVREAADTDLSKRIGTVTEDGKYIKKSATNNVSENLKVLDTQAKTNAEAIAQEAAKRETAVTNAKTELEKKIQTNADNIKNNKDEIARVNGELVKTNDYFNSELSKANDYFNSELSKTNNHFNTELGKTNAALQATNKRTAGIGRTDTGVEAGNQTVIESKVYFDQNGNVSGVKDLQTDTIHATGEITSKGLDAGAGDIKTTGKVSAGDVSTGTLETTGNATIGGILNTKDVTAETIHVSKSEDNADYKSEGSIIGEGGKLSVSNEKFDKRTNITEKSELNVNEKGTVNWATSKDNATGNVTEGRSEVTADNIKNSVMKTEGGKTFGYEENITADGKVGTVTDKAGNTSSTRQDSKGIYGYAKDKDGNKSYTKQEGNRIAESVIGQDGKQTKSEMTSTNITNTAKDGTITNTAKNVTNEGTESVTNTVGGNEVKVSTDGVDIKAEDGKKITESVGTTSRVVENDKITDKAADSTVTTEKGKGTTFGKTGSTGTTNIYGDSIKTGTINAKDTTTDKLTAGAAAGVDGGRLTVDADDGVKGSYKSGDYTSRSYILANTLKSGVDNGKKPTEDGFVGSRTDHYMDGDKAKLDETVKDAAGSNVTNKTSTGTATTITDGNGKTSATIQDVKNLAGSVTNGTETGVSGIHANDDGSVSIDSAVSGEGGSSVINQKKDSITSAVGNADGSISTVIRQDKDNVTIASSNGAVAIVGKDIVSNAQETITNTAGTSITNQVKGSKVTTDVDGTTFENKTAAVSDGGVTTTKINGNQITTGRVNANELDVSDTDGNNKADLLVKAGEGVKASASDGNTTGSLDVKADGITTSITNGTDHNTVSSTLAGGTIFTNSEAAAPVTGASGAGTHLNTTIKGNTITTGKVTMDYADVMKDLGVHGNAKIDGKTTTDSLEVTGTSTLKGSVTMESDATVNGNFSVGGNTKLKNTEVDGTLNVTQKATFDDSVSIAKDLSVGGDVTASSYTVGDKTYISAAGINANNQKITNVADGSISEGSKDAVNGGQLYGVKNDLEGKVNKVGANAAAMANLHPMEFDPDSKWNIAAAIGNYGSETAAALGAFYRPNDDVMVNLSTAFGTGENMVGGGVSVRLGKGGNKLSREETNALKAQVADLTARMDALLSVLNPNMSKDFPDVPENHWAYEAVSRLAGNDIVQGYPDGEFHGERTMTRYEMAEIIYNALSRGAEAEKELVEEFKPELQAMAASEKATAERAEG